MADSGAGDAAGPATGLPSNAPAASVGDVFLSHASHDRAIAVALAASLEARGISCWMAPRDVLPGTLYAEAIVRAITDSRLLVLVLSEHALASSHVGKELERASSKKRPIIALKLDAAPLTPAFEYFLSESQWIEVAAGGHDTAFGDLAAAVRRLLTPTAPGARSAGPGAPGEAVQSAGASTPRRKRSVAVGLAIIGLVVVIVGAYELEKVVRRAAEAPATASVVAPAIVDPSIAVLPFADMSQAKDQEYFADGMAEEILDLLAKIPALKVIARTSSFQFKGRNEDVRAVAEKLGVATVLEGTVRKAGSRLRITAQLIRAADGSHLWSESYDREVSDVFRTQDEIAGAVVTALKVSLFGKPLPRATPTANSEAYALYLRGRLLDHRYTRSDALEAQGVYKQALKLDPDFAPAWSALAKSYQSAQILGTTSTEDLRGATLAAARRALELDPSLAEAHRTLGGVYWFVDYDFEAAKREFATVRELDSGNSHGLANSAFVAMSTGHADEAVMLAQRALERDPLEINNYRGLGIALYFTGRLTEAENVFRRALDLNPAADGMRVRLALVLLARGQLDAMRDAVEHESSVAWKRVGLALAYSALGRNADADRAIESIIGGETGWAYQLAEVYAVRHDPDKTFEWLNRAYGAHDTGLVAYVKLDPLFKDYRGDPRYRVILKKLGLPES